MTRRLLAAIVLSATVSSAHDARPLSIILSQQSPRLYKADLMVPPSVDSSNQPSIQWPAVCKVRQQAAVPALDTRRSSSFVECSALLENRSIGIRYALFNPSLTTFIRLIPLDGPPLTAVLPPETKTWRVPARPSRWEVARQYMLLGIQHIWTGVDHLLFVVGLLMLARTGRRILLAITGFSVAHSITLSLSALGFIHIAVPPTEACIALSIIFLAMEILRGDANSLATRFPLLVSISFGLLHGLGFAAGLGEIGLPPTEIPTALLLFNVGVECGQLAFILPLLAASRLVSAHQVFAVARPAVAYGIGIMASFWFFERVGAFWQ